MKNLGEGSTTDETEFTGKVNVWTGRRMRRPDRCAHATEAWSLQVSDDGRPFATCGDCGTDITQLVPSSEFDAAVREFGEEMAKATTRAVRDMQRMRSKRWTSATPEAKQRAAAIAPRMQRDWFALRGAYMTPAHLERTLLAIVADEGGAR